MEIIKLELDKKKHGAFNLYIDDKKLGEMIVSIKDDLLIVYHTEVDPGAEGKGYAKKLMDEIASYAHTNNLMVLFLYPYVHAQFRNIPINIWKK